MAVHYRVTSDEDRIVPGLGVFKKGKPREFGPEAAESFKLIAGMPLNQDNTPDGVKVEILSGQRNNNEEG